MAETAVAATAPANFASHLESVAAVAGARAAIVQADTTLTWSAFNDRASRLAHHLHARGLGAASRVAIMSPNCPDYLVALFAIFKIGASAANVNYRYRSAEIAYILNDCRADALIYAEDHEDEIRPALQNTPTCGLTMRITRGAADSGGSAPSVDAIVATGEPLVLARSSDSEWLLYTGGTTGLPKAVIGLESERLAVLCAIAIQGMGGPVGVKNPMQEAVHRAAVVPDRPVYFTAAPLMHGTGLYCALTALVAGSTIVLAAPGPFDATQIVESVAAHRITDMYVVGDAMMTPIVDVLDAAREAGRPYDVTSLARVQSAGTVWSARTKARLLAHADVTEIDMIAATEGGPFAVAVSSRTAPPRDPAAFVLADNARLIRADGTAIEPPSQEVGYLAVQTSPNARYLGDESKSASTFRDIGGARVAVPGDLAAFNPDETLRLIGRDSSIINTGGEKVHAEEVEAVLRSHPGITDAVVVGVPHDRFGHVVGAVVTVKPGVSVNAEAAGAFVADALSSFKKPRLLRVVGDIHRLASGKPDLNWARSELSSHRELRTGAAPISEGNTVMSTSPVPIASDVTARQYLKDE